MPRKTMKIMLSSCWIAGKGPPFPKFSRGACPQTPPSMGAFAFGTQLGSPNFKILDPPLCIYVPSFYLITNCCVHLMSIYFSPSAPWCTSIIWHVWLNDNGCTRMYNSRSGRASHGPLSLTGPCTADWTGIWSSSFTRHFQSHIPQNQISSHCPPQNFDNFQH